MLRDILNLLCDYKLHMIPEDIYIDIISKVSNYGSAYLRPVPVISGLLLSVKGREAVILQRPDIFRLTGIAFSVFYFTGFNPLDTHFFKKILTLFGFIVVPARKDSPYLSGYLPGLDIAVHDVMKTLSFIGIHAGFRIYSQLKLPVLYLC